MKVAVTGGAGFIGSHLVDGLLENGHDVCVIDNFSSGKDANLVHHADNSHLTIYRNDINEDLGVILKGVDVVFHLAALPLVQYSIEHPKEAHEANVNGMLNVLLESKKAGVRRLVFVSSASVYGDQEKIPFTEDMVLKPMSPYAAHKITGEYYCKLFYELYGFETVCLRYFNVFGPRHDPTSSYACLIPRAIARVLRGEPIIVYGDGQQTRDFIYIADVVEATLAAGFTDSKACFGQVINIASGERISVNEVVKCILDFHQGRIERHPPKKEPRDNVADISKAKSLLGWTPRTTLKEGLRITFDYFQTKT